MSSHNHHVVVLGGGITGLSAAFYLARKHPTVQITLVEKSTRFGGWVRSERVDVCDSHGNRARVLLEAGPRTVRPNAKSILELVHLLDLRSEVICTPRSSPAARNRFLHVPHPHTQTQGLQPLPYSLLSLFTLPLGRLVLRSVLAELFTPANRPPVDDDESVDSFFSRRFGDAFARTLGSALIHGIYATDSRQLSLLATFPQLRTSEMRGNGSVIWGELGPPAWWWKANTKSQEEEEEKWEGDPEWETTFRRSAALFSFKEGMETLVRALVEALRRFPNVVLWNGTAVRRIGIDTADDHDHDDDDSAGGDRLVLKATHVISALPLPVLDSILQPPPTAAGAPSTEKSSKLSLPHLRENPSSSATVLNFVFPNNPPNSSTAESTTATTITPLHPPGFGYLIPRPEHGYDGGSLASEPQPPRREAGEEEPAPEPELGLLGVVFDTASLPEQDNDVENHDDAAKFIKLTAMLGGPYLSAREESSSSSLSDAQLVEAVLRRISSHLGHALPPPVHYAVHRNAECIPTYLVGHTARMEKLRRALHERLGGRMKVIGAGVGGVSVSDCVKAGRQAASEVAAQIGN
ncbi:protoporphyrinogen oxidase [Russula emetica]|nr:protoporphyrinogen oxidase [Russula emetica]